jgi:AraC-like DNA-binding protein
MQDNLYFRNNIVSVLIILGIIQGIFLAFFFLRRTGKSQKSNFFFGIMLLLFAIHNLDFWAGYSRYVLAVPFLLDISLPFTMAMGPLFYHYIFYSIRNKPDRFLMYHYIPFAFFLTYSLFFILQPDEFKYDVFIQSRKIDLPLKEVVLQHSWDPLRIRDLADPFISIQLTFYLVMSCSLFINHLKERGINAMKTTDHVIRWMRNLLTSTTIIIIISVIVQIFLSGGEVEFLLAGCFTIFIYYLSFNLIRGSEVLNQTLFPEKYRKTGLPEKLKLEYINRIERIMQEEKPFLGRLFSLKSLSRIAGIPPGQLSQLLNESFQQNFFEFTRNYRINEARRLLSDRDNSLINIEEIANRVGYNSKSAFNKAFLSITGETPLSFKKKNMK